MIESMDKNITSSIHPHDRRYFPRWVITRKALYRKENSLYYTECCLTDLSCEGACLLGLEEMKSDQTLNLVLYLADDVAVDITGKVLWNKLSGERNLFGVRFINVSTRVQDLILQHAFDCTKDMLRKNWFEGCN